ISDKQGISGKHRMWCILICLLIKDKYADRFRRMPRSVQELQANITKFQAAVIFRSLELVFHFGLLAQPDFCATAISQFKVSRNEVGMQVRENYVTNSESSRGCLGQVLID